MEWVISAVPSSFHLDDLEAARMSSYKADCVEVRFGATARVPYHLGRGHYFTDLFCKFYFKFVSESKVGSVGKLFFHRSHYLSRAVAQYHGAVAYPVVGINVTIHIGEFYPLSFCNVEGMWWQSA